MWRIFVDTGGTFTDALGISPDGRVHRAKVLSSSVLRARVERIARPGEWLIRQDWTAAADLPRGWPVRRAGEAPVAVVTGFDPTGSILRVNDATGPTQVRPGDVIEIACPEEAPVLAARLMTGTPGNQPLPPIAMRLATTRGTNALLTRSGARIALFITRGLGDLLEIGTQQRPDLFALHIRKPRPLPEITVEVDERLAADGSVVLPLDEAAVEAAARQVVAGGTRIAAIVLMHSDLNPSHERQAGEVLRRAGFETVVLSSDVSPSVKILPRAQTTVVEAALTPVVDAYVCSIEQALGAGSSVHLMTSTGGLVRSSEFRAKDSLLSGPAGGVVGAGASAVRAGEREVLAFDMGGTSTDVARWAGRVEPTAEHTVGEFTLVAPAVGVHTVAAGGGSICAFDGTALTVGPASAGASPGPACYGGGGPLTVTDVNLLAGRIDPDRMPIPIDAAAARAALDRLADDMRRAGQAATDPGQILDGLLAIAAERIAGAIRVVSIRRGHDPARAALLAFGGAGGQLACAVAERLGVRRILVPPDAGLLSAVGLAAARFERIAHRQVLAPLHALADNLPGIVRDLADEAKKQLAGEFNEPTAVENAAVRIDMALRYSGQETPLEVEASDADLAARAFAESYRRVFGYVRDGTSIELVWVRATASGGPVYDLATPPSPAPAEASPWIMRSRGKQVRATRIERSSLAPGTRIDGPALVTEAHGATVVDEGWSLAVQANGSLVLSLEVPKTGSDDAATLDAAEIELFTSRLEGAALAMGEALRRTSVSVNVKERLDYSCAVLDAGGRLVACAPHIPVHLGSLGVCVREVLKQTTISRGDVVVTNHPGCGGSHLPDVTVVAGAFDERDQIIGYVAARAHHAEIGGTRPGSMPPMARSLLEEGIVIPPMYAVRAGRERLDDVRAALSAGPHPSRAIADNLADINAAIAACVSGAAELEALARAHGPSVLQRSMEAIQDRSARLASEAIATLGDLDATIDESLDDGWPLHCRVRTDQGLLHFDFTGTGPVHPGNLNATPAIVNSCVVYVMRLLVGRDLPLNEGLMRPVRLILPAGLLNPPFDVNADPATLPAVVGGNVETSQRLVNMLLRGLGLCAESQGTMNNLIFGDAHRSYYETICGGAGAGPGFDGASAVHTHMTNTRITDPELLERRYPVRLERFAVRRGSGGAGRWSGGDGIERTIRFLAPMSVSVLTQRRTRGPRGLAGGGDGTPGEQWIERSDGRVQPLRPSDGADVNAGDLVCIRTPGGGAYGLIDPTV